MVQLLSEGVRVALVQHLFICARQYGLPCQVMLEASGLRPEQLKDPHAEVPAFHLRRMLDTAVAVSGDQMLGLNLARYARLDGFGVLGNLLRACASVEDALQMLLRFGHLIASQGRLWSERQPGLLLLAVEVSVGDRHYQRHATEFLLAAMVRCIAQQRVDPAAPLLHAVHFRHPLPEGASVTSYQAFFPHCQLHFNQPSSALLLPVSALPSALLHADGNIRESMMALAVQMSARAVDFSLLEYAGSKLRLLVRDGKASRQRLAEEVGLSIRHLNRQLAEQGYSYRALLDQVKREWATELLRDSELTVGEIAKRVDYSTSQAFIRWFRRSVGVTPQCYREHSRTGL